MEDARGIALDTTSATALEHHEHALWRMVSFYGDPAAELDALIAADPDWGLPRVMKAGFLLSLTEPSLVPQARALLEQAEPMMAQSPSRERNHLHAVGECLAGRWGEAVGLWEEILLEFPRDLLALTLAHLFDFYRGDARNLRGRVARVLPEWDERDPLYPYVLGMLAFGLEECNFYPQAELAGRQALALNARGPWAIHAVAHVMEMQGRHDEGARWLRSRRADWDEDNGLRVHQWWHLALFQLETLDVEGALEVYDAAIGGPASVVNLQWLDAAALLWRIQLLGGDVGPRWQALAQAWTDPVAHAGHYAFNDVHALMALLGSGDAARVRALVAACSAAVSRPAPEGAPDNRRMARDIGLPLMFGLTAYARGEHAEAVRRLLPLRGTAHRFGGSHAQRDVIEQTLLAACAGVGGDRALGRALINERVLTKAHTPLTAHWAHKLGMTG